MPILTPEERLGQIVGGRYRLEALLSVGGMGVLFRAVAVESGEPVAIKMLKPMQTLEPDRVNRFARETRIAQQLIHPNVARTLDAFSDECGLPFLVMELLEGRTLAQELDERSVLPLRETLAIAIPILQALEAAHALGVVHRDLKPSNIFLCRNAAGVVTPKLLDFGIAKSHEEGFETETGVLLGTPGYMAPEQVQYGECSPFTDIWGIGAVLYRCLAGHVPHALPKSSETTIGKLVREPVPALVAAGLPKQLCATIDRALARDPHRRYPSMEAFRRALAAFAGAECTATTGAHHRFVEHAQHGDDGSTRRSALGRGSMSLLALAALLGAFTLASWGSAAGGHKKSSAEVSLAPRPPLAQRAVVAPDRGAPSATSSVQSQSQNQDQQDQDQNQAQAEPVLSAQPATASERPAHGAKARSRRTLLGSSQPVAAVPNRNGERAVARDISVEQEPTTGLPYVTEW